MPLLPPAAGAALLRDREQCVITEPQCQAAGMRERATRVERGVLYRYSWVQVYRVCTM